MTKERLTALEDVAALATVGATYPELMLYLQSEIAKCKALAEQPACSDERPCVPCYLDVGACLAERQQAGVDVPDSPPASKPLTDERTAFKQYIDECDKCCIVPDAAGAFHAAWQAAHGIKEKK